MPMMLNELLEGWVDSAPVVRLTGICLDNRSIEPGAAVVAVQGQLGHGLDDGLGHVIRPFHQGFNKLQPLLTIIIFIAEEVLAKPDTAAGTQPTGQ